MYYGVKCKNGEGYIYEVLKGNTAEELFEKGCEAVFDDENNAINYRDWLTE